MSDPSPYRSGSSQFPWLDIQTVDGKPLKFLMVNPRSESWYGNASTAHGEFLGLIENGARVIDVGANEGYLSLLAAVKVGPSGRVIAIEPARHNFEPLKINIALNGFEERVSVVPKAAGQEHGLIKFGGEIVSSDGTEIEVVRLDEFLWFKPDVIKIDVEGFEVKVLRGSLNLLRECKPLIFIECHMGPGVDMRQHGDTPEQLVQLLHDADYSIYRDGVKVNELGHCVVARPNTPIVRRCRNPVVYTLAYGEEARMQASLMIKSLRTFGRYDGVIVVYTDNPVIDGATNVVNLAPLAFSKFHIAKSFFGMTEFTGHDRVLYLDADMVALNPISRILEWEGVGVPVEHEATTERNRGWFSLPPYSDGPGYNAGTTVADTAQWADICRRWWAFMMERKGWHDAPGVDQPYFNHMIKSGEIPVRPFPAHWVHFLNPGNSPLYRDTIFVHAKDNKVATMRTIMSMRELWM